MGADNNGETSSINRKLGISFDNNWLWTRGRHTVNFGFEIRRSYQDDHECQDCGGSFTFSAHSTSDGVNFNNTGSSLPAFAGNARLRLPPFAFETKLRNSTLPIYQDNIKITPKLTVDIGLRWDIAKPFTTDAVKGQTANQIVSLTQAPNPGAISNSTGQPLLGAANVLGNCSGAPDTAQPTPVGATSAHASALHTIEQQIGNSWRLRLEFPRHWGVRVRRQQSCRQLRKRAR